MIRLLYFIPIWLAFMALKFVVAVLGAPIVAYMWRYRHTDMNDLLVAKRWLTPWLNPEDWIGGSQDRKGNVIQSLPLWWIRKKGPAVTFGMWWRYHAIRNPSNGLRNFEWLDLDIDQSRVKYVTKPIYLKFYEPWDVRPINDELLSEDDEIKSYGYLCWQGSQAGAKWVHHWPDLKKDIAVSLPVLTGRWWQIWRWKVRRLVLLEAGPRHFVIKIGWRVEPRDAHEPIDPAGIRAEDSGFASKLLIYRKG